MIDYLLKNGLIPKTLYKLIIHLQIKDRLKNEKHLFNETDGENKINIIRSLKNSEIALSTKKANEQHYEVPTEFYQLLLGPKLKYSCCHYKNSQTLEDAEIEMLDLYCKRADIKNGQRILDLGCGWGSFTLYAAKRFPESQITAVSNSSTQKIYIDKLLATQHINNVTTITQDVNHLNFDKQFDRIISIEMFEHIRNYQALFNKLYNWLSDDGNLFIHHFCHQYLTYPFNASDSWMAKHFFKDGLMPSEDLMLFFSNKLIVENQWRINGKHYSKTCYDWINNLYRHKKNILHIFENHYESPKIQYQYWDIFLRACAQLFAYHSGNEWFVTHYLFKKKL